MTDLQVDSTPESLLSISILPQPASTRFAALSISGELDRSNDHEARAIIERILCRGIQCLIVDLSGLRFMDSSGIHLLLRAYSTLMQRHGRLLIVAPKGPVRRILDVVRISPLIPVYTSLQQALADFPQSAPLSTKEDGNIHSPSLKTLQ